jgi:hypothetical protein
MKIYNAKIMHKRFFPKENSFNYSVYYLSFNLDKVDELSNFLAYNKLGVLSFYDKDHGFKNGKNIKLWVIKILEENNIKTDNFDIELITFPRVLGYVFNPVSFYLCIDKTTKRIISVICEVNNTFGETHSYICYNNGDEITSETILEADKIFHVSPFLERKGHYKFCFDYRAEKLGIWIDFYDAQGNKKLITSLIGGFTQLNKKNLRKAFWKHPLVTFKAIFLIHFQAIKIVAKGIKYISKPLQLKQKISVANITKS